ncbi:MAG: MFS transporter [Candidatus Njordarchaeia archaeon]
MVKTNIRNVSLVTIYWSVLEIPLYLIYIYFTLFMYQVAFSPEQIGIVYAVGGLCFTLGQFLGGYQSDIWGRKTPMILSSLITPIALYFLSLYTDFSYVTIFYSVYSLFFSMGLASSNTILGDSINENEYEKYSAIALGFSKVPSILAIIIFIYYLNTLPLKQLFPPTLKILSLVSLSSLAFSVLIKETHKRKSGEKVPILEILDRYRLQFTVYIALVYLAFPTFWVLMSVFLSDVGGLTIVEWGYVALIWFVFYAPIQGIVSKVAERIPVKVGYLASGVLFSLAGLLAILKIGFMGYVASVLLEVSAEATLWPIVFKTEMLLTEKHYRGTYVGFVTSIGSIANSFGNYMGGKLYSVFPELPIVVAMIVYLMGTIPLSIQFRNIDESISDK